MDIDIESSQSRTRIVLSKTSPIRKLADEIAMATNGTDDLFKEVFERNLVRDIVYRELDTENTIRDLYNGLKDHTAKSDNKLLFDYDADDIIEQNIYFKEIIEVVENVLKIMVNHRPYDTALKHLKHTLSYALIDYQPQNDGVDHINVYSKSKTKLGVLCSNFAHTPFKHPVHGHFASLEGFWYWLMLGKKFEDLRSLYGYRAKKYGVSKRAELSTNIPNTDDPAFRIEIKKALLCKFEQHDECRELLKESSLPLIHYYCWGEPPDNCKITYPRKHAWITDYITLIRDYLNKKADKVLVTGSKMLNRPDFIEAVYFQHGIRAVEFISGGDPGTDKAAEVVARKLEIPCHVIQTNWEKDGSSAGYRKNEALVDLCTLALIDWDGESKYTKNIIDLLDEVDKPKILIK